VSTVTSIYQGLAPSGATRNQSIYRSSRVRYCTSRSHLINPIPSDLPSSAPNTELRSPGRALGAYASRILPHGSRSHVAAPWTPFQGFQFRSHVLHFDKSDEILCSWTPPRFGGAVAKRCAFELMHAETVDLALCLDKLVKTHLTLTSLR
jgi:hypothetical protein